MQPTQTTIETKKQWVVWVSHFVWESVVPLMLPDAASHCFFPTPSCSPPHYYRHGPTHASSSSSSTTTIAAATHHPTTATTPTEEQEEDEEEDDNNMGIEYHRIPPLKRKHVVPLLRLAEALFPLVGLVCRGVRRSRGARSSSRRRLLECCGEANSPRCCAWVVARYGCTGQRYSLHSPTDATEGVQWPLRAGGHWKECMSVLIGMSAGGHLDSAKRFVDEGAPWGSLSWPDSVASTAAATAAAAAATATASASSPSSRGVVFYPLPTCASPSSGGADVTIGTLDSVFWGNKAIPRLLDRSAKRGHLETLKWALSRFGGTDESWWLLRRVFAAARGFQLDTIIWLSHTFNLTERLTGKFDLKYWGVPKNVSDVKRLVETFPQWKHDFEALAWKTVKSKSPTEEIIKVCQWLVEYFPDEHFYFTDTKHCEVVKWALQSVNSSLVDVSLRWYLPIAEDVQFLKWLIERAHPTQSEFILACSNRKDNVAIAKLVAAKTLPSADEVMEGLNMALSDCNSRIATWLEEYYFNITKSKPKLTLPAVCAFHCFDSFPHNWAEWFCCHAEGVPMTEKEVLRALQGMRGDEDRLGSHIEPSLFLIEKFSPNLSSLNLLAYLKAAAETGDFRNVKKVVSLAESSPELEIQPIDALEVLYESITHSKIFKWLMLHFNLVSVMQERDKVQRLMMLISCEKYSCARWFFKQLHGLSPKSLFMEDKIKTRGTAMVGGHWNVDFAGLSLLMRMFPDINIGEWSRLSLVAFSSPLNLQLLHLEPLPSELEPFYPFSFSLDESMWWLQGRTQTPHFNTTQAPLEDEDTL
ncbi:hypothetical protein Pelo_4791 [Pelomyxa schiedti]|nr:hypothetical protein Pelo_4791 [Pelomyxa schiedti]